MFEGIIKNIYEDIFDVLAMIIGCLGVWCLAYIFELLSHAFAQFT